MKLWVPSCINFCLYMQYFHVVIQFKFHRSFAEKPYTCNFWGKIFSSYKDFQVKLSEVQRSTFSKYSIVKENKNFLNAVSDPKFYVCLKCCTWLVVQCKVISTSMPALHFVPMKTYSTIVSRSQGFVQKHYRNGKLFHFSNHYKSITSHILILRDCRVYWWGDSLVLFLVVFFMKG